MRQKAALMKTNYFQDYYKQDSATGAYIIEVALNKYSDVFNEWDPAPFKRRDIDYDLRSYLEECSSDIPLKEKVKLVLFLPKEKQSHQKESRCVSGLHNYFSFSIYSFDKQLLALNKSIFTYFLLGVMFLLIAFLAQTFFRDKNLLLSVLPECLFIGGWVLFWEAFSDLFFNRKSLGKSIKKYDRFLQAEIAFQYQDAS